MGCVIVVGDGHVVAHPHEVQAGLLGGPGHPGQVLGGGVVLPRIGQRAGQGLDRQLDAVERLTLGNQAGHVVLPSQPAARRVRARRATGSSTISPRTEIAASPRATASR